MIAILPEGIMTTVLNFRAIFLETFYEKTTNVNLMEVLEQKSRESPKSVGFILWER